MFADDLHSYESEIERAAMTFGARRIRVLGSVARGEDTPDSDVDFLVDFPKGYDMFCQRLPLAEKLAELIGAGSTLSPSMN